MSESSSEKFINDKHKTDPSFTRADFEESPFDEPHYYSKTPASEIANIIMVVAFVVICIMVGVAMIVDKFF
jgi:hypothetical protein